MQDLQTEVSKFETFHESFLNGNMNKGTDARKALMRLTKICKHVRQDILVEQKKVKQMKQSAHITVTADNSPIDITVEPTPTEVKVEITPIQEPEVVEPEEVVAPPSPVKKRKRVKKAKKEKVKKDKNA